MALRRWTSEASPETAGPCGTPCRAPPTSRTVPRRPWPPSIAEVRADGDSALRRLTRQFDGVDLDELRVEQAEIQAALARIPAALQEALDVAHDRILAYHAHESADPEADDFESGGIEVRHLVRPVARAGCYAPGGRARYPSTVLMCAVPAQVAGVGEIVLCVPPGPDGRIDDASLAAAAVAGIHEVYRVGGAQAIAAMAYGTESIEPVDVIVGPGNRYVAEAKRQVSGVVGRGLGLRRTLRGRGHRRTRDPHRAGRHRPGGAGRARPRRTGLAGHLVRGGGRGGHGPGGAHRRRPRPAGPTSRPPWAPAATWSWWTDPSRPWPWPTSWLPSTSRS